MERYYNTHLKTEETKVTKRNWTNRKIWNFNLWILPILLFFKKITEIKTMERNERENKTNSSETLFPPYNHFA
jgi:hypothetical protein